MHRKILYVITKAEHGGAQSHVLQLLHAAKEYYQVALASGDEGFLVDRARQSGLPVFVLPHLNAPLNPLKDVRALAELLKVVRIFRPSLIHAHSSKAGMIARAVARIGRIPCVFTAHGWAFSEGVSRRRKWVAVSAEWLAGHLGAKVIAVSEFDRKLAIRYRVASPKDLKTIRNGICDDPGRAIPEAGDPPVITMVARFSPQKDHLGLLRAVCRVNSPFTLQFVGDGPLLNTVRTAAENLGIAGRTRFLGATENVSRILMKSQGFALVSKYEGLPISILEAMRAGLPVVATDTGGIPEIVHHNWNGFLVGRSDEKALSRALEALLSQPGLRARFGRNSRLAFEEAFLAQHMVNDIFDVYERTLR